MIREKLTTYADQNRMAAEVLAFWIHVGHELKTPWNYISALLVGSLISVFAGNASLPPFVIPLFVQILAKAATQYKNRNLNTLIELPAQREDPAFIMDDRGHILLATGNTHQLLSRLGIQHIRELAGEEGSRSILENLDTACVETTATGVEIYSEPIGKWYKAMMKPMAAYCGNKPGKFLVWFRDITAQKEYDLQQHELLHYTGDLVLKIRDLSKRGETLKTLASFILAYHEAVFITRKVEDENATGFAFKRRERTLVKSRPITLSTASRAPVFLSRKHARIVADEAHRYPSDAAFREAYPFCEDVVAFIDAPIRNFINYHAGDISIIVFNSRKKITHYEEHFMEVVLNLSQSILTLVDLARENDEQFLQKVMGLCAAAEYSDKITGKHILRVNEYSRLIADRLGLDRDFVETIGQIAALHDIGKVAIPEFIKLPRRYTRQERLQMQMHTIYGADIIETMMRYATQPDPRLEMARNIALHHHQAYDGSGYPLLKKNGEIIDATSKNYRDYRDNDPLSGEEIPLEGLIVGLADRYDALRSRRQYKAEYSHARVVAIMTRDDRNQVSGENWYGPRIWRVFQEHHEAFGEIYDALKA